MGEGRTVHPDCRNSWNPYHECSQFCYNIIAEAKKLAALNQPGMWSPTYSGTSQAWKFFDGLHLQHHPDWSPSTIKYALMTTAWKLFDGLHLEAEFAYGSGHINPLTATDLGLVHETLIEEYLKVCYRLSQTAGSFTATNVSCPNEERALTPRLSITLLVLISMAHLY